MDTSAETRSLTQYTIYSVFRRPVDATAPATLEQARADVDEVVASFAQRGVTLRGFYDVSGFRYDGDVLVWIHGEDPQALQAAVRDIRRTALFANLELVWQVAGVHVAAEFNERHMPAFMLGKDPEQWITIYPFVRSYDWYLLPEEERSVMLRDHGIVGSRYKEVLANTVASFGISDYEWMLAFEAPELIQLVDMMRALRYTEARLHVREEVPFYTGRRIETNELATTLRYENATESSEANH